ncbi:hypothetical protein [Collinsella tanakaei]|uniref:hypothetical protein n=2 Tax=Collinsella tanakaei TaxID=626935 RepID=UPI0022E6A437|nr:hypothetical protein [Collinsella tanakaei]
MAYTDMERRILDMWPKFEDGCYVQLGDKAVANSGENKGREFIVRNIYFENGHGKLKSSVSDGCYWNWKSADPYVKRPAPKVLDADGVEIKVGDTVWHEDGREWLVEELNRYGVRCFDGAKRRTFSSTFLTHNRPDSWGRLEEDAAKGVCEYAGAERKPGTINVYTCCGCRFDKDSDGPTCDKQMAHDLVSRAKALAEKEAAR